MVPTDISNIFQIILKLNHSDALYSFENLIFYNILVKLLIIIKISIEF